MPFKANGRATDWREIDEWDGGAGWLAYPEETMQRASHVLDTDGGLWLVDPVDADGLDEFLAERGEVRGVTFLWSQHRRDAVAIADRHDVPVYVPDVLEGVAGDLDARTEVLRRGLPDSEYGVYPVVDVPGWREAALYGEESGTLVVGEALGNAVYFVTGDERLGVHPALRWKPPGKLDRFEPERVLLGHGTGVFEGTSAAVADALAGTRRRIPRLYAGNVRDLLLGRKRAA